MTTDDDTPGDEGPITPEVVRRGASSRKRRVGQPDDGPAPDDSPSPVPGRPVRGQATGRMFRTACLLLIGIGVIEVFLGATRVTDPEAARCTSARFDIDAANDDDEDFNDVDLPEGVEDADDDDLDCDEAVDLAAGIPDDEDEPADGEFPEASTFRTQGIVLAVLGLAHGLAAFFTLRTRSRAVRNFALVTAAAGIFLPILGIVSLLGMLFVVYGLAFSADAKVLFPRPAGAPSLFRPRPPAAGS
jgi:hypothetical protein